MNRKVLMAGSVVALVLLLAGAAFMGMRLLAEQGNSEGPEEALVAELPGGLELMDGETSVIQTQVENASELPETEPDAFGLFERREDNSIFVGTGEPRPVFIENEDGTSDFVLKQDGPELEVVVTGETAVYKDVTELSFDDPPSGSIQQEVAPGSADEVGDQSSVLVWGQRRGDRIIAQVLVYSEPQVFAGVVGP